MPPEAVAHLQDLRSVLMELTAYTHEISLEAYLSDGQKRRAVERCLEIAGEALIRVRRCDVELLALIPNAQKIIGMRNILAHEYGEVNDVMVWEVLQEHLSGLHASIQEQIDRLNG